jgi:hypothetical protein
MFKKLFITAAATAAVSVPLAGVAWATPSDVPNNPPGHNPTGPGIPNGLGATADLVTAIGQASDPSLLSLNPNGSGKVAPGQVINEAKDLNGGPGVNTPTATGAFVNDFQQTYLGTTTDFTKLPPGLVTKTLTPGCQSGNTASAPNGNIGPGICN